MQKMINRLSSWGFCLGLLFSLAKTHPILTFERPKFCDKKTEAELVRLLENQENSSFELKNYSIEEYGDNAHVLNFMKDYIEFNRQEYQILKQIMVDSKKEHYIGHVLDLNLLKDFNLLMELKTRCENASKTFDTHQERVKSWLAQSSRTLTYVPFEDPQAKVFILNEISDTINSQRIRKYSHHIKHYIEECLSLVNCYINIVDRCHFENDKIHFDCEEDSQVLLIHARIIVGLNEEIIKDRKEAEAIFNDLIKSLSAAPTTKDEELLRETQ